MDIKISKPPVHDTLEPWYWNILLILGVIIHICYAIVTHGMVTFIGASLGTMTFSIILIPLIRKITSTVKYFTKKNVAIALYVGLCLNIILSRYA